MSLKADSSLVIELPNQLVEPTLGTWIVRHCTEKLKDKYGGTIKPSFSAEFDAYCVARATEDPLWVNRIEGADLTATHLMHSRINDLELVRTLEKSERISKCLRNIPCDLGLEAELRAREKIN